MRQPVLDMETVQTGLGAAFLGPFRADGKSFGLVLSRPDAPTDIHAVDVGTGAITPLRAERRPGIADAPPMASSIAQVPAFDGLTIPVKLFLPEGAARAQGASRVHAAGGRGARRGAAREPHRLPVAGHPFLGEHL